MAVYHHSRRKDDTCYIGAQRGKRKGLMRKSDCGFQFDLLTLRKSALDGGFVAA